MKNKRRFHLLGIGGISMSALAKFLQSEGYIVTGSDENKSVSIADIDTSDKTKEMNIYSADVVVKSNAILDKNKDLLLAKKLKKQIWQRGELLNFIASKYKNVIAVSGTHGKTTTTEMIAEIFIEAELNPSVHIGGVSNKFSNNYKKGDKKFFITEACEYYNAFLCLKPTCGVVTNIEPEHLDFFQNFDNEKQSFETFKTNSKFYVLPQNNNSVVTSNNITFSLDNSIKTPKGYSYIIKKNNKEFLSIELNAINKKNIIDSLFAVSVADHFGIKKIHIQNALQNYCGVKRRMEILNQNPLIIHDYAHHPTEIQNVISSVKEFYNKKIIIVFQPHTYSRTLNFFEDFVRVLGIADEVFLLKTFPARETESDGKSAKDLYNALKETKSKVYYFANFEKCKDKLMKHITSDSLLLILGAGDINKKLNFMS